MSSYLFSKIPRVQYAIYFWNLHENDGLVARMGHLSTFVPICSSISMMSTSHSHHTTIVHASIVNTSFSNEDQFCTQFCVIYPKTDRIKITPPRVWLGFDLKLMGNFFNIPTLKLGARKKYLFCFCLFIIRSSIKITGGFCLSHVFF